MRAMDFCVCLFGAALTAVLPALTYSQDYPNKPIRLVTSAAGGGSDFTARRVAQGISGALGQPIIVDNRPTGVIPAEIVSKAPPDGYTVLLSGSNMWIIPLLQNTRYDGAERFFSGNDYRQVA